MFCDSTKKTGRGWIFWRLLFSSLLILSKTCNSYNVSGYSDEGPNCFTGVKDRNTRQDKTYWRFKASIFERLKEYLKNSWKSWYTELRNKSLTDPYWCNEGVRDKKKKNAFHKEG